MTNKKEYRESYPLKDSSTQAQCSKVVCLGKAFSNEEERRAYFRNELRKKLPELKKIEGFPIGEDDDIIALSDPPYYTACPNPWLNDFIAEWEKKKETIPGYKKDFQVDEPYASDVSEGKNNPIYNAHSYHTKVPHPAIMRYILHYTQPGDIVFDGFAGTGMTGVAAQLCGNPDPETKYKIEREWHDMFGAKPAWGARKGICGDLSPIASFIAYNYNTPVDVEAFEKEAKRILKAIEDECGWMYTTLHCPQLYNLEQIIAIKKKASKEEHERLEKQKQQFSRIEDQLIKDVQQAHDTGTVLTQQHFDAVAINLGLPEGFVQPGRINYTVWSDVFICPICSGEIVFWEAAVDHHAGKVMDEFRCPHCQSLQTKRSLARARKTVFDKALNQAIQQTKSTPVLINYTAGKARSEKAVSAFDHALIEKIESADNPYWYPTDRMPDGYNTEQPKKSHGITHVHHFYTRRNLHVISDLNDITKNAPEIYMVKSAYDLTHSTTMSRMIFKAGNKLVLTGYQSGTLYISSIPIEKNIINGFKDKIREFIKAYSLLNTRSINYITSSNDLQIIDSTIDYIFTDPPFGANIMYSELNFLWESWLKVKTNNKTEAIENKVQNKTLLDYHEIMARCFGEYYRILKPGKWMTVEFSNTSATVWNGIQTAIQRAGFIIANVAALDKQQGSFKAVTTPTAVKQDLIISCYKPSEEFENKFRQQSAEVNIWSFVQEHLQHMPVHLRKGQKTTAIIERSPKILYDRLITFYLMRGLPIPIDATDFQAGLRQRFTERDGMYFTTDKAAEYDEQKAKYGDQLSMGLDVIYTENDAIQWLKSKLKNKPAKRQDLYTGYVQAIQGVRKNDVLPELDDLLNENFIQETDGTWRVPDLNEAKDREALRNRVLLKEFNRYVEEVNKPKPKKLKDVRVEALRAGFKACWEKKDFATIVLIAGKISQNLLLEDEQLLMYYDIAKDRVG